tara:strand:- start:37 stop:702 length:666 start_codon:yes stop_codon:yes gene_type:complete
MSTDSLKIFLDTADTNIIKHHFSSGMIDGITTNPSLIMKSGRDPEEVYQELKDLGVNDISMEVMGDSSNMIVEGRRLASKFGKCATIKVPCTYDGLIACRQLSRELIRVNVTLIFDVAQAILSAKAGAAYVSPFVGRLDDNSIAGLELIKNIDDVFKVQCIHRTRILSASIRYVNSVSQSFANGADIVTMPPAVFEKMYNHVLTDKGLEIFENDAKNIHHA